jgi:NAD(P)-dependent dehydrogenase (short-subunit alcohol dehydrogenase family)
MLLAERGGEVAVGYRDRLDAATEVVKACRAFGRRSAFFRADIGREDDVVEMFSGVEEDLGSIEALVVSAAVVGPQARVETFTAERVQRVLTINVVGSLLCAREAIRRMSTRHAGFGGSIVFLSSAASRLGSPGEYVDYAASKGAIDSLTVGLAREVASDGIRVNAVRPGIVRTDIHATGGDPTRAERLGPSIPIGRVGEPEEIAHTIAWLLSNEASYVTGALVDVSGGR